MFSVRREHREAVKVSVGGHTFLAGPIVGDQIQMETRPAAFSSGLNVGREDDSFAVRVEREKNWMRRWTSPLCCCCRPRP